MPNTAKNAARYILFGKYQVHLSVVSVCHTRSKCSSRGVSTNHGKLESRKTNTATKGISMMLQHVYFCMPLPSLHRANPSCSAKTIFMVCYQVFILDAPWSLIQDDLKYREAPSTSTKQLVHGCWEPTSFV